MVFRRLFLQSFALLLSSSLVSAPSGLAPAHEEPLGSPIADPAARKALEGMAGPAACQGGMALAAFPCRGIDLESYVSLDAMLADTIPPGALPEPSGSALWGFASKNDGREYAVFGTSKGTAVVDVTDPPRP